MRIINVIEILEGSITRILSFPIFEDQLSDEVVEQAEKTFSDIVKEHREDFNDEDIETLIEDGSYHDDNGYSVQIVWFNI